MGPSPALTRSLFHASVDGVDEARRDASDARPALDLRRLLVPLPRVHNLHALQPLPAVETHGDEVTAQLYYLVYLVVFLLFGFLVFSFRELQRFTARVYGMLSTKLPEPNNVSRKVEGRVDQYEEELPVTEFGQLFLQVMAGREYKEDKRARKYRAGFIWHSFEAVWQAPQTHNTTHIPTLGCISSGTIACSRNFSAASSAA